MANTGCVFEEYTLIIWMAVIAETNLSEEKIQRLEDSAPHSS